MLKEQLDLSSFTGSIQQVEYGVRNKVKHICFNYDNGKSKTFYNLKDATIYCKKYWRGATWDIHEGVGTDAICVAKSD
jgi:hypothetical protein